MRIIEKITYPLNFLKVQHDDHKWFFWIVPLVFASVLFVLDHKLNLIRYVGEEGALKQFASVLQILTGFFVASLAAVATFQRKDMDEVMIGIPPTYEYDIFPGQKLPLTNRQYMCFLFGYLAFMSLGFSVFFALFSDAIMTGSFIVVTWVVGVGQFVFLSFLAHVCSITALGLYFLCFGIHRDRVEIAKLKQPPKPSVRSFDE